MNTAELHQMLVDRFGGDKITGLNAEAKDPWIEVSPAAFHEVALFLKSDERCRYDHLNDLCGVDYLEPDPKKRPNSNTSLTSRSSITFPVTNGSIRRSSR